MTTENNYNIDIAIFGAGIAGLWTFHRLRKLGYNAVLFEKNSIGHGQTIASQGIIHSGLKFSLVGKVNKLAQNISKMPDIWRNALQGEGDVDLSTATANATSQHLLIPPGFMGGLTALVAQKALGKHVRTIPEKQWPDNLKQSGFRGNTIFMGEPVLDIPSVLRALAEPYRKNIYKITEQQAQNPLHFLEENRITARKIIFTGAADNKTIAEQNQHNKGLETQKRPLMQGMIKNAPFPLWAHLVGKTDKPVASITSHYTENKELIWYLGGGVAERAKESNPADVHHAMISALNTYMPNIQTDNLEWSTLPIDRVEGKSKTDSWMPDIPTIHDAGDVLYCWPTKLTFSPMLSDMIISKLQDSNISPSQTQSDIASLPKAEYAKTPWDTAQWKKQS
ncbi:MAG: FAD-dependent oxidoreductase [Alphaproteobacteria bacterium]